MIIHPEELRLARAYDTNRPFEPLTAQQLHAIMERGRALFHWFKAHPHLHNLISLAVVSSLLLIDGWALLGLPRLLLDEGRNSVGRILVTGAVVGAVHGWLMYSLVVYSLHEGAAHNSVFVGTGPLGKAGLFLGRNLCRISHAEPDQYATCHMAHHAKFGTEEDSEFLNFVLPHRYWLTFLPFAALINFTDFLAHRPMTYTRSRIVTAVVSFAYNGGYGYLMYQSHGALLPIVVLLGFLPHLGFYFDRARQFTEHNLMPLDNRSGSRSFGVGFWGLLVGGGPWGQPCHLAHHLVPSVPWYQQIVLHRFLKRLLTPQQREQFLVAPVIGFPRLLWRIVHDANNFEHAQRTIGSRT